MVDTRSHLKFFREYKKKIELAKAKMSAIHRKQKETEKIANFSAQNSKKWDKLIFVPPLYSSVIK